MQHDKTTLKDLSIFTADGSKSVFDLIDKTATQVGRDMLRRHINYPPNTYDTLIGTQQAIQFWSAHPELWPNRILNGTIVMLDKYFESADNITSPPAGLNAILTSFFQKILNKQEYFFTQFSLSHLADFLNGCTQLTAISERNDVPEMLRKELLIIKEDLQHRLTPLVLAVTKQTKYTELLQLNYKVRREMKHNVYRLINSYARLDAWQSMGKATAEYGWVFPEILPEQPVAFEAGQLRHPLLEHPVAYDITFADQHTFLLLTGANMSGKTTFMRALGVGALLAHLGMGVPASAFKLSFLHGIITNMHVEDNILKGESYFFAEVQCMKQTAEQLLREQPHLVLMDELFKGTNVHDAYECTKAVIEGLLNHPGHLMLLSTHLYEVAQQFTGNDRILFAYFVTQMAENGNYDFTYKLRTGISNDRIGYRILQKEGVIDLLRKKEK